jgi:hypothetical protein
MVNSKLCVLYHSKKKKRFKKEKEAEEPTQGQGKP